jgi:hypothetical protein
MRSILADLSRLILILLLLPIIIIVIGPLLVLAVFRERQQLGPLTLDSSRYDLAGKAGILMLGLALWLLVWSGLAWLTLAATSSAGVVQLFPSGPTLPGLVSGSAPTATALPITPTMVVPTPTPVTLAATPTIVTPPPAEAAPTVRPTETQAASTATATATRLVSDLATEEAAAAASRVADTTRNIPSSEAGTGVAETSTPSPTPVEPDPSTAIETVAEANLLLQNAITLPSEENLASLAEIWQDRALTKVEEFAIEQHERYGEPFGASFEFISSPQISEQISPDQLVVTARERWRYGQSANADEEAFEFIYTLDWEKERWIITRYTYRNLPVPISTPGSKQN